ncbi:hypothetical protein PVAP13_1NG158657 [Panicum virgatum]|uniref:Uncharacterized protein n=1 Tax=Panicum virgatum TaxID=38727 RepID=A0A8T0WTW0_PANVG|nr:hypothetical protein PVAP13_1NG158657 [Panicum virgatum]
MRRGKYMADAVRVCRRQDEVISITRLPLQARHFLPTLLLPILRTPPARPCPSPVIPRPFPIHREPDAPRSALMCAYGCSSTGASPLSAISRVSPSPALYLFYLLLPLDTMKERWICRRDNQEWVTHLLYSFESSRNLVIVW